MRASGTTGSGGPRGTGAAIDGGDGKLAGGGGGGGGAPLGGLKLGGGGGGGGAAGAIGGFDMGT